MGKYDGKFNGYNGNTAQYLILVAIANELAELNKNLKKNIQSSFDQFEKYLKGNKNED